MQTPRQTRRQRAGRILLPEHNQLQQIIISQNHEIDQIINQELSQNPALEIEDEPFFPEDMESGESDDENWDQDLDKPYDEYETGERLNGEEHFEWGEYDIASNLEQTVIEYYNGDSQNIERAIRSINLYRITGALPEEANKQLHEDLKILQKSMSYISTPSTSPTFEVTEEAGDVEIHIVPTIADSLMYKEGLGKYSSRAKKFVQNLNDRALSLSNLATVILKHIQGDFFRQTDIHIARQHLIPIIAKNIPDFEITFSLKLDKRLISKLSDLLVESKFGIFPLGFFLSSKATLIRFWVMQTNKAGISTIKDQCEWIKQHIHRRIDKWDSDDKRFTLIKPLLEINVNDIKNARKHFLNNK